MSYLIAFMFLSGLGFALVVGGVGYYLHRKKLDKAALDAVKKDVTDAINK